MGRILEDAEIAFLRKCREACAKAAASASKEIKKDFKEKVFDQAVDDYYSDYSPTRYKRSNSLYKAFKVKTTTDGNSISISWDWDFNRLPQYKSRSKYHQSGGEWVSRYDAAFDWDSDDNGTPEKGWIFTNFMEGIHPVFVSKNGLIFDESYHSEPSYIKIKEYKEKYIHGNDMKNILLRHLKNQCKNL